MLRIASTVYPVAPWISPIWVRISSVAFAVWLASDFTSLATTAKPLPASPARAASIVASQRQQVGLTRDRLDQLHDLTDALRRLVELLDRFVGAIGIGDRL